MRRNKTIYWIFTSIIFAFDSVIPALTSHTKLAVDGIRHLGFPDYFRVELTIFKVLGGIVLILPMIPRRYKEWAYAGFGINFISAAVAHMATEGFTGQVVLPLALLAMLVISYVTFQKISNYPFTPTEALANSKVFVP